MKDRTKTQAAHSLPYRLVFFFDHDLAVTCVRSGEIPLSSTAPRSRYDWLDHLTFIPFASYIAILRDGSGTESVKSLIPGRSASGNLAGRPILGPGVPSGAKDARITRLAIYT